MLKILEEPEFQYGTATDNPFADPAGRQSSANENEALVRSRRIIKTELKNYLPILRNQAENRNWRIGGGHITTEEMAGGTVSSNFAADCVKMFESFRPGDSTCQVGSDLYVVAANIYEWITGRSLIEKDADFSLEHYLRKAVEQFKRTISQN